MLDLMVSVNDSWKMQVSSGNNEFTLCLQSDAASNMN
jgi:hypothetical protein